MYIYRKNSATEAAHSVTFNEHYYIYLSMHIHICQFIYLFDVLFRSF